MFGLIKQVFIGLCKNDHVKCMSLNNQQYMTLSLLLLIYILMNAL